MWQYVVNHGCIVVVGKKDPLYCGGPPTSYLVGHRIPRYLHMVGSSIDQEQGKCYVPNLGTSLRLL